MVKAAITPIMTRESMIPSDRQLVLSSTFSNNATTDAAQYERGEEIKRSYSIQNRLLAKKNGELQARVSHLENQLFQTQRQVLSLKNEKIQLTEKLKLNSKRFNDIIVDSFDNLMSEYRSFMADVGVDVEKKNIPINLSQKVKEEDPEERGTDFENYWQNINNDLQRRKSCIFRNRDIDQVPMDIVPSEEIDDEEQLDTLVEKSEEEDIPLGPEYEDNASVNIPVKKQTMVRMEKLDNFQLADIPFLSISNEQESTLQEQETCQEFVDVSDNCGESLFVAENIPVPQSPVKSRHQLDVGLESADDEQSEDREEQLVKKTTRRKSRIPRELKNLDTEKTKKWIGMDPLDDVEESTSDRRKSRRRSLVVNYQLPSLKQKMRRSSAKFHDVYVDDDKENRVTKPKAKANKNVLRNITNTNSNNSNIQTIKKGGDKKKEERSIFDIENTDIFGEYNSRRSRERNDVYDLLL